MINAFIASAALMAGAALADSVGQAIVVNNCDYDVTLANTPSAGGGYTAINQVLSPNGQYSQTFTQLSNSNGWSIKLSRNADSMSNIMQYEYTFHNDGTIWYDLSDVNGNPWNGNWEIDATGDCTPKHSAYRFSTDDAYGMQSCPQGSSITVTLCSGSSGGSSGGSGGSSYSAAPSSPAESGSAPVESSASAVIPTTSAPASIPTTTGGFGGFGSHSWGLNDNKVAEAAGDASSVDDAKVAPSPTTLITSSIADRGGVTVTNIVTQVATQYVTATASPAKRHEHHPRHPHHLQA